MNTKERVRKLLAQARDQEGTPEGEAFQAKAFELAARYGLTEFDLEDSEDLGADLVEEVHLEGSYRIERQILLGNIAAALGCAVVRFRGSARVKIAGSRANVEKTRMLYDALVLHMMSEAGKLRGRLDGTGTTQQVRHSFMIGYAAQIHHRLREINQQVHEEVGETSGAVALVDELQRSRNLLQQHTGRAARRDSSRSQLNARGVRSGRAGANRADLGQTRMEGKKQLSA